MATLSNEAEELHRMCLQVNGFVKKSATVEALANLFGVEPESPEYFSFISAIRLRFKRFLDVVEKSVANERHRSNLRAAAMHLRSFTDNGYWQADWNATRTNVFTATHLMALDMAGGGLSSVAPVVVLTEDERNSYVDQLYKALGEVEASDDFVAQMVSVSIRSAIRMIELFDIFGSAAISEKLFETHAITKQAAEIAPKDRKASYASAAVIVGLVLNGLVNADGVFSAIENFYTRANTAIEMLLLANPPSLKLLSPPTAETPETPEDVEA
ncbi:hypothetical protein OIU34_26695 [Pararhizobium sp. BT-229]|uniref:hypothetical protein n=1 Tax=Pararhizobium sp. BT-229 TaxID=2986923 RepID=UPI0021F7E6AF|nr:hypothetical protein [Pararhizobium sp. BT-229]MCV9965472.1 hypothetical protein [Pararhizobium sp. BT-229]